VYWRNTVNRLGETPHKIENTFFSSLQVYKNENALLQDLKKIYDINYDGLNKVRNSRAVGATLPQWHPFEEWMETLLSHSIIGTPETCIKRIQEYMDIGVTHFIFRSVRSVPNLKKRQKNIKILYEEVINHIKTD